MNFLDQFSRENRQSITGYLYAFAVQLSVVIVAALIYFPELKKGIVSVDFQTADSTEAVDFGEIEIQPEIDVQSLDVEPVETDELEFSEFETEALSESSLSEKPRNVLASVTEVSETKILTAKSEPKSGFFGIEPEGNRIVYVIDMSISMNMDRRNRLRNSKKDSRWERAVEELLSSVQQLTDEQEFYVYLFCFEKKELFFSKRGAFSKPTKENINRLKQKLNRVRLGAGTDPRECIADALDSNPSCVFLLSDGEFNGHLYPQAKYNQDILQIIQSRNRNECPIHTIGLEDQANQRKMISISKDTGGMYRFVPK